MSNLMLYTVVQSMEQKEVMRGAMGECVCVCVPLIDALCPYGVHPVYV